MSSLGANRNRFRKADGFYDSCNREKSQLLSLQKIWGDALCNEKRRDLENKVCYRADKNKMGKQERMMKNGIDEGLCTACRSGCG